MLLPYSTPSTPLHRPIKYNDQFSNYTAPVRSKVFGIPLPPQELPDVINEFSLRKAVPTKLFTSPNDDLPVPRIQSGAHSSTYGSRKGSNVSSRPNTPTRRLSSRLSIRRRRRSSTGISYDSAYAGRVTKEFLRDISRALVKEKQDPREEQSEIVFKALDQQLRHLSTSPDVGPNDFDYSLPLPSDNDLMSSDDMAPAPEILTNSEVPTAKPAFKSYLERIIALRGKKLRHSKSLHLVFDSPDAAKHDTVDDDLNTSRFVIENTLSGLSDVLSKAPTSESAMKLAEPVAFGSMNDVLTSNESSVNEVLLLPKNILRAGIRTPQLSLGNFTPEHYDNIYFEKINQLDVPSYEPIPFNDHDNLEVRELPEPDSIDDIPPQETPKSDVLHSDLMQSDMIQGHFTIDDHNIDPFDSISPAENFDSPDALPRIFPDASTQPRTSAIEVKRVKRRGSASSLPNRLVKGFAAIAQNISQGAEENRSAKRRRAHTQSSSIFQLISQKSEDFLENVMLDLGDYAKHRNSHEINISDAVLYFNRIQSFEGSTNFAAISRSIFPLEYLQSLDNSLQASALKAARNRDATGLSDEDPDWLEHEDSEN